MDQSEDDSTRAVVESFGDPNILWHRMPRQGACPARNLGAALARAPLVAFLDDDCCPRLDWVERIVGAFAADPELQFIFGQLKAPAKGDRSVGWYPEFLPSPEWQAQTTPRRVAMVAAGANMSTRKDFLLRIGGFDELLGPACPTVKSNDSSISYKVLRSGAKWIAEQDIEVIHEHGFRRHVDFARLVSEYDHGLGVNWARFARRGDARAAAYFCLEHWEMTVPIVKDAVRLRRPRGLKNWVAHLAGFVDGLRVEPTLGYVDGPRLRRMAETRSLDG